MLHVINSVESKWLYETGKLVEKIEFFRKQSGIEHVFVTLHFAESPQHFSYLRVHKSKSVYYDSLNNAVRRHFNEYPRLQEIGKIEIHKPDYDTGIYFTANRIN